MIIFIVVVEFTKKSTPDSCIQGTIVITKMATLLIIMDCIKCLNAHNFVSVIFLYFNLRYFIPQVI